MRPSWDTYFLGIAEAVSKRGDCTRSKVGAVIVDRSRIVVSTGFNGVTPGAVGCLDGACPRGQKTYSERPIGGDYRDCIGIHAEDNAIRFARQAGQTNRLAGATIYITRQPCDDCNGLLNKAKIEWAYWPGGSSCG